MGIKIVLMGYNCAAPCVHLQTFGSCQKF